MGTFIWRRARLRALALCFLALFICILLNFWSGISLSPIRLNWLIKSKEQPFLVKRNQIDCDALFKNSGPSKTELPGTERQAMSEYKFWETVKSCKEIRQSYFYPKEPNSEEEAKFPLAYVIFVDGHLEQLEMLFNAIYAPQNFYCFHVDFRAHYMVHDFVARFVRCFDIDHVFLADQSVPIAATSVSILYAQRACLLKLLTAGDWKYVLTIDGQDFPLRTNREIVEILKLHGGSNDVELVQPLSFRYEKRHQAVTDEWGQQVDMEETTHPYLPPPVPNLKIYKGSIASALSRDFTQFLVHSELSIKVLTWLAKTYMPSELYVSTMNHNSFLLNISGGYPGDCLAESGLKSWVSRFTVWNTYKQYQCQGKWNNGYCIFGTLDLHMLEQRPELFAHAFDTQVSTAVIDCLHERLYNRTYLEKAPLEHMKKFDDYYKNLSTVRFEKWKREFAQKKFVCVTCDNCEH